jgi:hypothetical protein
MNVQLQIEHIYIKECEGRYGPSKRREYETHTHTQREATRTYRVTRTRKVLSLLMLQTVPSRFVNLTSLGSPATPIDHCGGQEGIRIYF